MFTSRSNRKYAALVALAIALVCAPLTAFAVTGSSSKKQVVKCAKKTTKKKSSKKTAQTSKKKKRATKCMKRKKTAAGPSTSNTVTSSGSTSSTASSDPATSATSNQVAVTPTSSELAATQTSSGAETSTPSTPADPPGTGPASADSTSEPEFTGGEIAGTVTEASINEASGIVASHANADVLWVHNDSGDSARLFAINTQGELLGTYAISGASATDWEDISIGPGPIAGVDYLYIGDTGDNSHTRSTGVKIYRVAEPSVSADQAPETATLTGVQTLTVQYPSSAPTDGATGANYARDSETLMVDPQTGDIYLLSKRTTHSQLFSYSYSSSWTSSTKTLTYHGELGWNWAVSGEFSPDGDEIIVKSGTTVYMYDRPPGTTPADAMLATTEWTLPYTLEPQGEAIAFDSAGLGYYTLSEGVSQPLYYYARTD